MVFRGNGVVWDKENNKRLCRFTPAKTIKILIGLGYEHEGEMPEEPPEIPPNEPSLDELKEKAKELGITFAPNIGYDKLLERVRAAENDS